MNMIGKACSILALKQDSLLKCLEKEWFYEGEHDHDQYTFRLSRQYLSVGNG